MLQAMHKALGFGADRVAVVVAETENNFRQFGECTKDGEYYGYAVLARKIGQIIHDTVEVDTSGQTEPVSERRCSDLQTMEVLGMRAKR